LKETSNIERQLKNIGDIMDKWLEEYVEMIMEQQEVQNKIFKGKKK
jgi:hypothetical protein